jgi:hypothetical protein
MRIEIEDVVRSFRDVIVVQEAGIPGPQGDPGDLSTTIIVPPLEYNVPTHTLRIAPGTEVGESYEWTGTEWEIVAPRRVVHRIVTAAEEAAKEIVLASPVTKPAEFLFDIADGGGSQFPEADFVLIGSDKVSWEGYALDGVLGEGDRVRFVYR